MLSEALANSLISRLSSADFDDIVTSLEEFEQRVQEVVVLTALEILAPSSQNQDEPGVVLCGSDVYAVGTTEEWSRRQLSVTLTSLVKSSPNTLRTGRTAIQAIGWVREVRLSTPPSLAGNLDSALAAAARMARVVYQALEDSLFSSYSRSENTGLSTIDRMYNVALSAYVPRNYRRRHWFSVTDLKTGNFIYTFSTSALRELSELLKANPPRLASAASALVRLMTEDVDDLAIDLPSGISPNVSVTPAGVTVISFLGLPTLGSDTLYWETEGRLYSDPTQLGALEICRSDDLALGLNFDPNDETIHVTAVHESAEPISDAFRDWTGRRKRTRDKLAQLWRLGTKTQKGTLRDIFADVTAKTIAEILEKKGVI